MKHFYRIVYATSTYYYSTSDPLKIFAYLVARFPDGIEKLSEVDRVPFGASWYDLDTSKLIREV